ncbi:MAG: cell division protein FtsW [Bacteroidetes bacterium]|nr:cell division protein FtsW [Bacteroidota bacterium]
MSDTSKHKIDIWILIPVLLMLFFSIGAVYSASSSFAMDKFSDPNMLFRQHTMRVLFGIVLIFAFAKLDYRMIQKYSKYLIWISILMLIYIFFGGVGMKGASRWISLGPLSFQPSDFAKYTLIIYVAALLARKKDYLHLLYKGYMVIIFYVLFVSMLVAFQPNFSVSMIILSTSFLMLFLSEVKLKHLIFTGLIILPFAVLFVLSKNYILNRLSSHSEYASGGNSNYQLMQAIIGFGNGGITGIGPGNSIQRDFYLPEAYGDFIFSIVGEEYGFIGTALIITLFALFMFRGYRIVKNVQDDFGRYLAFGITTVLSFYAVINMCVATGVIPTTGVPLPFISYGGTALFFNSIAVGILLNISSFATEKKEVEEFKFASA